MEWMSTTVRVLRALLEDSVKSTWTSVRESIAAEVGDVQTVWTHSAVNVMQDTLVLCARLATGKIHLDINL